MPSIEVIQTEVTAKPEMYSYPLISTKFACNLCGSYSAYLVATRCRTGERLNTVVCAACGLGRRDPMPQDAELADHYRNMYRVALGKGRYPSKRRLWRLARIAVERCSELANRVQPPAKTLDIGCGAGELVSIMEAVGYDSFGFDPDKGYIEWAISLIGSRIFHGDLWHASVPDASFDLITMYHVLEHLRDPYAALQKCALWLKPGGCLVIEVPNFKSVAQAPTHIFHRDHLFYFTMDTLPALAQKAGLRLETAGLFNMEENLRCSFILEAGSLIPLSSANTADGILDTLSSHQRLQHYLTIKPYRRAWARLRRTLTEASHTWGKDTTQILEFYRNQARQDRLNLAAEQDSDH